MTHDVFVSFKSEDKELAEKICDDLASKGIKCWISSRGIRGGQNYQEEIGRALLDSAVMILVFSASADKSDEILKELSIASKYKKHVIPVRIEDFLPGMKFMYEMATRQYIDLFKNWEKEIDHLAEDIRFMMARTTGDRQQVEQQNNVTSLSTDNVTKENKYLDILTMAYADGGVTSQERDFLDRKANELGISTERVKDLEEQIKREIPSIQRDTELLPNEESQTTIGPDEGHIQSDANDENLLWPDVGHDFLKNLLRSIDVSCFPFIPTAISKEKHIRENLWNWWQINDKYFISIILAGKRNDMVQVHWGLYSEAAKRDPKFRQTADELCHTQELLDEKGNVSIDGCKYEFNEEGDHLGFEASQRKKILELINPDFMKYVKDHLASFTNKIWFVIEKNLINS